MADYEGLNPEFSSRLQAFIAASGGQVWLTSGYRSPERQSQLFAAAVQKYGSEAAARKWVAPPGKSNHNHGVAGDLGFANAAAREWAHANAARYGLTFPMSWEPWHIEPIGRELLSDPDAYTTPPTGQAHPADNAEDPYAVDTQMRRLLGIMASPVQGPQGPDQIEGASLGAPGTEIEAQASQLNEGLNQGLQEVEVG